MKSDMRIKSIMIMAGVVLLAACNQVAPQRPTQRSGSAPQIDSAQLAVLELNQQLALAADKQLTQFAQAQEETYALYESNTWITVLSRGDEESACPAENEEWTVHMRVYDLEKNLLVDSEAAYRIGKNELPLAVEANISELHHGAEVRMIVPWYAAFGMQGTAQVPPYENVIIEMELR